MLAIAEKKYSVEEYLALEKTAEVRHEFVHGKIIPMPGESILANLIALNLAFLLRQALKGKGFTVVAHDVQLIVDVDHIYRYPDVAVAATAALTQPHAITQPILIAEVFSKNSAHTDRGEKLLEYTQIPSLQHYLLVSQSECLVEIYSRRDTEWGFSFYKNLSDTIELAALGMDITLQDLYEEVVFETQQKA